MIKDIVIGDVDKPSTGSPLDQEATATASGDINWSVPVLWVRDDLQITGYLSVTYGLNRLKEKLK